MEAVKFMSDEEKQRIHDRQKAELTVLKAELASIKPGRAVYLDKLGGGHSGGGGGHVLFKVNDLPMLKSNLGKELKKLK